MIIFMYQNVTKLFTRKLGLLSPNFQVVFLINLANNVRHQTSTNGGFNHHVLRENRKFSSICWLSCWIALPPWRLTWHMTRPRVHIVCTWAKQTRIIECLFMVPRYKNNISEPVRPISGLAIISQKVRFSAVIFISALGTMLLIL